MSIVGVPVYKSHPIDECVDMGVGCVNLSWVCQECSFIPLWFRRDIGERIYCLAIFMGGRTYIRRTIFGNQHEFDNGYFHIVG